MKSRLMIAFTFIIVLALLVGFGIPAGPFTLKPVAASAIAGGVSIQTLHNYTPDGNPAYFFARYTGITGESQLSGHIGWIDVLSFHWGASSPIGLSAGRMPSRSILDNFELTFLYDKAEPKLEESCLKGTIFPLLEVEICKFTEQGILCYLKYEFKNVRITNFDVSGSVETGDHPTVIIANAFDDVKVTYTEYNETGSSQGQVTYTWKTGGVR
jgi:type VI secretion system secreted protein Hcp